MRTSMRTKWKFFSIAVLAAALMFAMTACGKKKGGGSPEPEVRNGDPTAQYAITVKYDNNGIAYASVAKAAEGETITINAVSNNGFKFDKWTVLSGGAELSDEAASPTTFTMPAKEVEIEASFAQLPPNTPNLELSLPLSFGSLTRNYSQPPPQAITIYNTGTGEATISSVSITDPGSFKLTDAPVAGAKIAAGNKATFMVQPLLGLSAGKYSAAITVGYDSKTATTNVQFEVIQTYTITMDNDGNGTAKASPAITTKGTLVTITAVSNANYGFSKWEVDLGDGVTLSNETESNATFTMPADNVKITAYFDPLPDNTPNLELSSTLIKFSDVEYGYAQPKAESVTIYNTGTGEATISSVSITDPDSFKLTDAPVAGAKIAAGDGKAAFKVQPETGLSGGTYSADVTVTYNEGKTATTNVQFKVIPTYAVTVQNDTHGTASASVVKAAEGTVIEIEAKPNNGYKFDRWEIVSGGASPSDIKSGSATFIMPADNVTIKALFAALVDNTPYLTLLPSHIMFSDVESGYTRPDAQTVTIYNTGTDNATIEDISITDAASFELSAAPAIGTNIAAGAYETFKVQPKAGLSAGTYAALVAVKYDTDKIATTDVVQFRVIQTYTVTMQNDGNGTTNPNITAAAGATIEIDATPNSGYKFDKWVVGSVTLSDMKASHATFTMPAGNVTIKAVFEALPDNTPYLTLSYTTSPPFSDVTYGYGQPAAANITIYNTGTGAANVTKVELSGDDAGSFVLGGFSTGSIAADSTATSTVQPKAGLNVKKYIADIIVTYDDAKTATIPVSFTVNKAAGASISTPPVVATSVVTNNSITIPDNAVTKPSGQDVQYFISTSNNETNFPDTSWQTSLTFGGLDGGTTYYIYARSAANGNYNAGAPSGASAGITTLVSSNLDSIVFSIDDYGTVFGNITVPVLYVSAESTKYLELVGGPYDSVKWFVDGNQVDTMLSYTLKASKSETPPVPPDFYLYRVDVGTHSLTVEVVISGKTYNKTIPFEVQL